MLASSPGRGADTGGYAPASDYSQPLGRVRAILKAGFMRWTSSSRSIPSDPAEIF